MVVFVVVDNPTIYAREKLACVHVSSTFHRLAHSQKLC